MKKTLQKIRKIAENLYDYIPEEARKLLPLAGIVLLAFVLIIVIIIAQRCGRKSSDAPESAEYVFDEIVEETVSPLSESEVAGYEDINTDEYEPETERAAETEPETEAETEPDYGRLKKNGDPELLSVMQRYFSARAVADLDAINELYGITDETEEERAENLEVLQFNARYVSSFDNITTYEMEGPYKNSWLVYTTTDVNFYTAYTKAPTIMWCFIEKNDDGEYIILDSHALTEELYEYAEEENHSPEVRALAADINGRLREALQSDPELDEVYGILRSGSPLWENTQEAETTVAVIEDEEIVLEEEDSESVQTGSEGESDYEAAEPEGEVSPENEAAEGVSPAEAGEEAGGEAGEGTIN